MLGVLKSASSQPWKLFEPPDITKLRSLLAEHPSESAHVEYKREYQPRDKRQRLEVVKDVAAMSATGGVIVIGVGEGRGAALELIGLEPDQAAVLDEANVQSWLDDALHDPPSMWIRRIALPDERQVLALCVPPTRSRRLPRTKSAQTIGKGKPVWVEGQSFARHGTRVQPATTEDHQRLLVRWWWRAIRYPAVIMIVLVVVATLLLQQDDSDGVRSELSETRRALQRLERTVLSVHQADPGQVTVAPDDRVALDTSVAAAIDNGPSGATGFSRDLRVKAGDVVDVSLVAQVAGTNAREFRAVITLDNGPSSELSASAEVFAENQRHDPKYAQFDDLTLASATDERIAITNNIRAFYIQRNRSSKSRTLRWDEGRRIPNRYVAITDNPNGYTITMSPTVDGTLTGDLSDVVKLSFLVDVVAPS